ncbi:DUF6029 family protein [Vicingaceae bacterium]|nr:DUF6029 family protein [Vicingaceae bacterium]
MKVSFPKLLTAVVLLSSSAIKAQDIKDVLSNGKITGNFQIEAQYYQEDSLIGAEQPNEQVLSNGFLNLIYTNGGFSAGVRYESYQNALLGYPTGYKGSGIPYRFASYKSEDLSVTVGNFYEQFGNGLVLRAYEERGLGYDNALDGIRVKYKIKNGVELTGLIGQQRFFFEKGNGIVRAFDATINLNETFEVLSDAKTKITVGGSVVSKYQEDDNPDFILPENVPAFSARTIISRGKFNVNAEYAFKANDPNTDNLFNYRNGDAAFIQATFSQKGLGISLSAKRVDNFSFRSDRTAEQQDLFINYQPALTKQHTYNLLATLYPYATQPNGETALQGDVIYNFKKGSILGGKYGTGVQLNAAFAFDIQKDSLDPLLDAQRNIYTTKYFETGQRYFRDLNIQINKKLNKKFKMILTYSNLLYNQAVIEGKPPETPIITAHIGVVEGTYKFNMRNSLRFEAQVLKTKQDQGDWATGLLEYSYSPHWFVAALGQYNYDNPKADEILYYNLSAGYNNHGNRISLSYGRQRAGIFCVGGVCRVVPASNGLYLSITSSF